MTRYDIREGLSRFSKQAMIVMVFPLLVLAGSLPAAAATAALDNLELTLGATTYRIPRLTLEGGDAAAVASVFQSAGPGIDTRLADLSAKRIVIPELLTETRVGTVIERARYRDVILTDVTAGRIAVAHATAAEQAIAQPDGREARLDWRGLSLRGVNLPQLARVVAPGAAEPSVEPPKPLLDEEIIESVSYESLSGDVSLRAGRVALAGAKARPSVAPSSQDTGLKELARAALSFAFERFEIQNLVIEGRVPDARAPFALRIGKIELHGLANGTLAGATLDRLALTTPEGGTATLAHVGLGEVASGSLAEGGLPRLAHADLQDVAVDLPTPQSGQASRQRLRLAGARLDLENFRDRTPTKFALSVDRFFIDLAARGDAGLAAPLRALGYDSVELSASAAGGWDEKSGDVVLAPVRIAAKDMLSATLSATFGNVSALAFSSWPLVARAAAAGASFKTLDLALDDGALIARLMSQQAKISPPAPTGAPGKPRVDAAQTMREAITQTIGAGPNARRVSDALADYLRAPQKLHLRLAGRPSINALDFLARKPAEIFEGLSVEATTRPAEPAPAPASP